MEAVLIEDKAMVLNLGLRTRQSIHRTIQYASAFFVLLVLFICIITLVTRPPSLGSRTPGGRRSKFHSENKLELEDIFISVKTTSKFHRTRLSVILETWFNLAPNQITFFTDQEDEGLDDIVGPGRLVPTPCPIDHSRHALACKMQHEINAFLATDKKWFCHFDDDQYVNVPRLVTKLREFPLSMAWYLGKPSIPEKLQIQDKESGDLQKRIKFWFGTGGAGFCLSRPLTDQLARHASGRKFISVSEKLRLPDDVTMGYIISILAGVDLTRVEEFHSHLEPLHLVRNLQDQISFSYSEPTTTTNSNGNSVNTYRYSNSNIVEAGLTEFSLSEDPTRFKSIHCRLFSDSVHWCPQTRRTR